MPPEDNFFMAILVHRRKRRQMIERVQKTTLNRSLAFLLTTRMITQVAMCRQLLLMTYWMLFLHLCAHSTSVQLKHWLYFLIL